MRTRVPHLDDRIILATRLTLAALVIGACGGGDDFAPESCSVNVSELVFGEIAVGTWVDRTFVISNTGGRSLSGTVTTTCPDYLIVSEGGPYSIPPGGSREITVRFQPLVGGVRICEVRTGEAVCGAVSCTGTGLLSDCQIAPDTLSFGPVEVGASATRSFTITNAGEAAIVGRIGESCPDYAVVAGGGAYTLGRGQSRQVTVRFTPGAVGGSSCRIELGSDFCDAVGASGLGVLPGCSVAPSTLEFGAVPVGSPVDLDFTITNTGGTTLDGEVDLSCTGFTLVSGGGAYSLAPGRSRVVVVRFSPPGNGPFDCLIETGDGACTDVTASGEGLVPGCNVLPATLEFGAVEVGASVDRGLILVNTGGTTLTGEISADCPGFSLIEGGGPYSLAPDETRQAVVRFTPSSPGPAGCEIGTGNGACASVPASGEGVVSACEVMPSTLDFGAVEVGELADTTFSVRNVGSAVLEGEIGLSCEDFSIIAGGGGYSLDPGDSVVVTVRFEPGQGGPAGCTVDTGHDACADVSATGRGLEAGCETEPSTLEFGSVPLGGIVDRVFILRNIGETGLEGEIASACDDFSLLAGGGAYQLAPGDSIVVAVRFAPETPGISECLITTGNPRCGDVPVSGEGAAPGSANPARHRERDHGHERTGSSRGDRRRIRCAGRPAECRRTRPAPADPRPRDGTGGTGARNAA